MGHQRALVALLSDGRFHSGEALGSALGVSRAQIWQVIKSLAAYGVSVESVRGQGYRLSSPLSLLDSELITANVADATKSVLRSFELFFSIDSTNAYLMKRAREGSASGSVCIAEHQSAGMGRRGRNWVSPLGRNLYLSLLWRFPDGPARLGGLSLIMAMAVIDALHSVGVNGLAAKWPNDIVSRNGKVGGILMEVAGEHNGPCYVVIGIGLNIGMPLTAGSAIEQSWSNIITSQVDTPSRNVVAIALLDHLFEAIRNFETEGAASFMHRWSKYDFTRGKEVNIQLHDKSVSGVALGVDERGFLIVAHDGRLAHYSSGEISLRLAETSNDSAY